ncbi:hypothetical protein Hanom_Chr16g01493311 [Helianthus anomalus]
MKLLWHLKFGYLCARTRHTGMRAPFWLPFMRACVILPHFHALASLHTHARVCHVTSEPIRSRHTVAPYWLALVRRVHTPARRPTWSYSMTWCARLLHLVLAAPVFHHTCAVKNTKAALKRHIAPNGHATRTCASTLHEYTSMCVHVTIRKECSHLNTPLSFISPPMWDKVPLSHYFSIQCFKHQTLSINISFILAPFWTWFSSLRNSSNIEHKPTNKYVKTTQFFIFISSPEIEKMHFLYLFIATPPSLANTHININMQ